MAFSPLVCMVMVGVLWDLCTGMSFAWDPRFRTQGWSSQSQLQGRMGSHTQHPDQECISPILVGASHSTVRFTNQIAAQPLWLQSCENECTKMASNHMAQPTTETDQPRSKPGSTPQKGKRCHDIAASRSHIRMTRSVTPKSLSTWAYMNIKENYYELSPQLWKTRKMVT